MVKLVALYKKAKDLLTLIIANVERKVPVRVS